jgi:RNA polymerase sigma-70 factor (ECF subfamily)
VHLTRGSTIVGMLGDTPVGAFVDSLIRPHSRGEVEDDTSDLALHDDEALVTAIRSGRREAEELLYRRHAAAVLGLATRLLRSREEGMDVLQDAFVTAFEKLGELRDPAAFRSWLLRVTASLVHRRFRRTKLLKMLGLGRNGEVALDDLADPTVAPDARVELRWLDRKLASVDPKERAAWMLRHIDGFALDEVAEACGCSLATAKRRIATVDELIRLHFEDGAP